jgi:microcystin-dependent protein
MDTFKILVLLVLGFLIFRELTRKTKITMENLNSDTFMEMTPNGVRFTQPVNFASTVVADNISTTSLNILPRGSIIAFNSATAPTGWALCDGTNGTPDLRGRFILGAGQSSGLTARLYQQTGGVEKHTLTIPEMPQHDHGVGGWKTLHPASYLNHASGGNRTFADTAGAAAQNFPNIQAQGGNQPHENMPPFYVLTYIMKL